MILTGHAWIAQGSAEDVPRALALLKEQGNEIENNSDLSVRMYATFGVDDAHELSARAISRALGARRVFVVVASTITTEAQNALLKTLEEPRADALFLILVPTPHTLLRTILSRVQIVRLPDDSQTSICVVDPKKFLSSSPSMRIEMLKPLLEKTDDDVYDTPMILRFLANLEHTIAALPDTTMRDLDARIFYDMRKYATDRGALVKSLLESLALLFPVL